MTKFQNAHTENTVGTHALAYTYMAEESERADIIGVENEVLFCPDSGIAYYWSKEYSEWKPIGWNEV